MARLSRITLFAASVALLPVACGTDGSGPAPAGNVVISSNGDSLGLNTVFELRAQAFDAGGGLIPEAAINWSSSNPSVASVAPSGLVTGRTLGQATIRATTPSGFASRQLRVVPNRARADSQAVPMIDIGTRTYLGFAAGLYPDGNQLPSGHAEEGARRARLVVPRDAGGQPAAGGAYVLLSIGMSNATMEWCRRTPGPCEAWTLTGQAGADPEIRSTGLVIANGAKGSQTTVTWISPSLPNYDRVRDSVLAPLGVTEQQVQVIWFKVVTSNPSVPLPASTADALHLESEIGQALRAMKQRYPNLQIVFLASRTYGGYATGNLNPEPFAFESGLAVRWAIAAQIRQMASGGTTLDPVTGDLDYHTIAPWIAWGPYFWTTGSTPRSDGLAWLPADVLADGVHPSQTGVEKAATLLLQFFKSSPYARCWMVQGAICP